MFWRFAVPFCELSVMALGCYCGVWRSAPQYHQYHPEHRRLQVLRLFGLVASWLQVPVGVFDYWLLSILSSTVFAIAIRMGKPTLTSTPNAKPTKPAIQTQTNRPRTNPKPTLNPPKPKLNPAAHWRIRCLKRLQRCRAGYR